MVGAFNGIKVLDLTRLLPGNLCTMLLADMGAEVIKVEEPREGDYWRDQPPFVGPMNAGFWIANRNKRSLALDLKGEEGKEVFHRLVAQTDVLVETFRPGVMDRLGLGYATLSKLNPRLIYCAITGYGQDGPYSMLPGHDTNYVSIAGMLSLTGPKDEPPYLMGAAVADLGGGTLPAAFAITTALYCRERTGIGQYVDISMTDWAVWWMIQRIATYVATGVVPVRGQARATGADPFCNIYETQDGRYIAIHCNEERFWANLCKAIGREDLTSIQFATGQKREEVFAALRQAFRTKTRDEWVAIFKEADTCASPVLTIDETLSDPHFRHRGLFVELEHPEAGKIMHVTTPTKFSQTPPEIRTLAPKLGEHTDQVLTGLDYSPEEVARLKQAGVVR